MRRENRIALDGIELKPCPFCGEYVSFTPGGAVNQLFEYVSFTPGGAVNRLFVGECPGCGMEFRYKARGIHDNMDLYDWHGHKVRPPTFEAATAPFLKVWNKRANEPEGGTP